MGTYRITAVGKELAGFGQVGNLFETLFPLATILHRNGANGKSMDLDFPTWLTPVQYGGKWENRWYRLVVMVMDLLGWVEMGLGSFCQLSYLMLKHDVGTSQIELNLIKVHNRHCHSLSFYVFLLSTGLHYKALPRLCEIGWISCVLFTYCRQEIAIFFTPYSHNLERAI